MLKIPREFQIDSSKLASLEILGDYNPYIPTICIGFVLEISHYGRPRKGIWVHPTYPLTSHQLRSTTIVDSAAGLVSCCCHHAPQRTQKDFLKTERCEVLVGG